MFAANTYAERRNQLKNELHEGVVLFLGNDESPMNYFDNAYHFRQDSCFLYYFGLSDPGMAAIIDLDQDQEIIFGYDYTLDDVVWMGPQESLQQRAERAGIKEVMPVSHLGTELKKVRDDKRKVHFLPPYRSEHYLKLKALLGIEPDFVKDYVSLDLITTIVQQRSLKTDEEIEQIEIAHAVTREMHLIAMRMTRPGLYEREVVGAVKGIAVGAGGNPSFPVIFSVHGETLHNHYHGNQMKEGDLVVHDSGAETTTGYAADITRTIPVSGVFSQKQKDIYEIVLKANLDCIAAIKPGVLNKDIHMLAARTVAKGLKDLGLMKGDVEQAVTEGAHALFFPHGIGHMMGLDVHDMENLGEKYVGYNEKTLRSSQFGLAYLRLAKELQPGYVITIEPGVYFIPTLIEKWKSEKMHEQFINYKELESYTDFGGIRLEDDILVTANGHRVIGKPIPKAVEEVEKMCGNK
jgi:Xaa-Pro aminopeptidase